MDKVNLKKEELLDEYIKEKKWKLAHKLIESRQKKGDKSDALLVRKIITLLSFPDETRTDQGMKDLAALLQKKPPVTDHLALKRLDVFLADRKNREEYSNNLWTAGATASPEEDFYVTWYHLKFDQQRYEAAQKAAQTWAKAFPKHRTPYFLWILSSHLVSMAPNTSDMNRKVAQGFAYKLLAKAAEEVPLWKKEGKDPSTPPRALNTEQDVLLLVEVYTAQHRYSEALAVLEDPRTGYASHLTKNKWDIVRRMIGLYELSENWKGEWDVCSAILVNVRPDIFDKMTDDSAKYDYGQLGDDWRVWDGMVTACGKLDINSGNKSYVDRTNTIIDQYCNKKTSRNADLANIKLHTMKAKTDFEYQKPLVSVCIQYFDRYCAKVTCFQDIRPYVANIDRDERSGLLSAMRSCALNRRPTNDADNVTRLNWITAETNVMKFEYHFVISRDDNVHLDSVLPAFVSNCVRLYKCSLQYDFRLPPSDRLPGDDAAILAAMTLVRMYKSRQMNPRWAYSLLRSVALLKFANNKSPHNYDVLLILIRVYMYLGAGSLALGLWNKLSIKNVQNLTVSWMMFMRLSTLHPYPVRVLGNDKQTVTLDPLEEAVAALRWHQRASHLNSQSTDTFRANGQWMMQLDALEAKAALDNGFSRLMLLGESTRTRRLRFPDQKTEEDSVKPIRLSQKITDTRDSTAFPDYEAHGQTEFWRVCPSVEFTGSAITGGKWLAAMMRQALTWDRLQGVNDSIVDRDDLDAFSASCEQQANALSNIEGVVFHIGDLIDKSLDQLDPKMPKSGLLSDSIGQILLQINALGKEKHPYHCNDTSAAAEEGQSTTTSMKTHFGLDIHTKYCLLEICQFVLRFITRLHKANRSEFWMAKVLTDLQAGCKKLATAVWKSAVDVRADLARDAFLNDICRGIEGSPTDDNDDEVGNGLRELWSADDDDDDDDDGDDHGTVVKGFAKMLQNSWIDAYDGVMRSKVVE